MSYRIAVFASGQGNNLQALVDAEAAGTLGGQIDLLVCDKPNAPVIERAKRAGVDCFVFNPKSYPSREDAERDIIVQLKKRSIDLIVLAGYMRLLTSTIVEPYMGRIINIHPSLLPAFPGKDAIGQALRYGVKVTGVTVHFVDGGMDTGPIIAQRALEIDPNDDEHSLAQRIHRIEQELYPQVVSLFVQGKIALDGRLVTFQS
ncbi:phosphoribosylglycinamide formyltransferase [Paenibacillus sediminis]|uniref:Phosphoribosylglycinamide formyltransferase n=1 Tax=Paenibacillus sediminis TaxID=664909 RepID=A0ABS4H5D9_9BACL|nr:phosphoribosylglycinamide formyltransferase [Paenibacillus sediminis]MBP1937691.1 phosphoribosylglycinamide formyltransferase-1 [Paenibacillus sediminis]